MRWYDWFLEEKEGSGVYQHHYQDVQSSLGSFAWKALKGLVVDTQRWTTDKAWLDLASPVDKNHPKGHRYVEFMGQIRWVYTIKGDLWCDYVDSDTNKTFPFPLTSVVSYRSTGFPKVAYSSEQYLIGYLTILNWLEQLMDRKRLVYYTRDKGINIHKDGFHLAMLLPQNMHRDVYTIYKDLMDELRCGIKINHFSKIRPWYDKLLEAMVRTMQDDMVEHNKPPYHHTIEWHLDERVLAYDHPLVQAYLALRQQYPRMIVGNGFIEVK